MTLPRILRTPSTRNSFKKSELSLLDSSDNLVLRDVVLHQEFDIIKTLNEGSFSKVLLVRKRNLSRDRLVLKVIHNNVEDFYRELNYTYFLSPHPSIIKCYNVSIMWEDSLIFPLEYAPFGNLQSFIIQDSQNLTETATKLVAKQLASALEFIHGLKLVHRDISPDNVLVFKQDFSQIKLCDFGSTRPEKSLVACVKNPSNQNATTTITSPSRDEYKHPPEICQLVSGESYYTHSSSDVWQLGILIFVCLTGSEPWTAADDISDPSFSDFVDWLRRKSLRIPEPFQIFGPRLLRLFKRMFEPKPKKRCEVREVYKYLDDDWVTKLCRGSSFRNGVLERKASSSTNRSRSSGRNNSMRRKQSVRINSCNNISSSREARDVEGSSLALGESKEKMSEVDRDFVKERIGQWIMEASSPNSLAVVGTTSVP